MTTDMMRLVSLETDLPRDKAALHWFDQIRELLLVTGLAPLPEVYDLLWRYVHDDSHDLSLAVDTAIACGSLDLAAVTALRRAHCGEVDSTIVRGLVEAAHGQAEALTRRIEAGRSDLADYGRVIADGGVALGSPLDTNGLAALLDQLGDATTTMQAANTRLQGELAAAAAKARTLSEKLGFAERAAITDPLTGVLNRRGTFEALARLQCETRDAGQKMAATLIDIDHFKRFNDRFGHDLGDDVLRFVARHVADRIAPSGGIIGRLGGEEFVALL
ncbi:MAG: diguanylate cyclase, partial [Polymorphobacter sp.]